MKTLLVLSIIISGCIAQSGFYDDPKNLGFYANHPKGKFISFLILKI